MSSLARIIEKTQSFLEVAASEAGAPISLAGAEKYSIQVEATVGDSIFHLEVSNSIGMPVSDDEWTEKDDATVAEGASAMFEVPQSTTRWARIVVENNDAVDVSAQCLILVIGDAQ